MDIRYFWERGRDMISGVNKVILAVDDQEQAKAFWVDKVGFELAYDQTYGDERWVEVRPPSGEPVLVLTRRSADVPTPAVPDELPHSNVFFTCEDIAQTYEEMSGRGVSFPAPPAQMHFGWWAMFEDHEGTRYALSPTPSDRAADPGGGT